MSFECFKDSRHNGASSSSARLGGRYEVLIRHSAAQAEQNKFRSVTLEKERPMSGNRVSVVSGGWSGTRTLALNGLLGKHVPFGVQPRARAGPIRGPFFNAYASVRAGSPG